MSLVAIEVGAARRTSGAEQMTERGKGRSEQGME